MQRPTRKQGIPELPLKEIRKALELTQEQIAQTLGTSQDNVSRVENRTDLLVSTLKSYVEAMGGSLTMIAEFPAGKIAVTLTPEPPARTATRSSQLVARSSRVVSEGKTSRENPMRARIKPRIDRSQIEGLLENLLKDVGADVLSSMGLLQVEAALRQRNPTIPLPGKTAVRECINSFRSKRWPQAAPKKLQHWSR